MDIDKLKLYLDFGKFFLGTFLIGLITFVVKSGFESREIAIKESEQIGKYVEIALREDIGVRKRFAEYFKTVTVSQRYRNRWTTYYELVRVEFDSIKETADLLQRERDSLETLYNNLQHDNDSVRENLEDKIYELTKEQGVLLDELEVKSEENIPDTYQIILNSFNPEPRAKEAIIKYINDQRFELMGAPDHEYKKSWMADSSTIFYYSRKSRFIAEKMASDLKKLTGASFTIRLREDSGRSEIQKDHSFIIHYINR